MKIIKSNMTLLGLILMGLIAMYYSYDSKRPIEKSDLFLIKGELEYKPKLITWGGDMPYYEIELKIKGDDKDYSLINCGYDLINEEQILNLNIGQQIQCYVNRQEYKKEDDLIIYSLQIDTDKVFSLSDFNNCYLNYWKRLKPIIIIMLIILMYRIIIGLGFIDWMKKFKNNFNN